MTEGILSFVGGVEKGLPEGVWKEMSVEHALSQGRELYDWQYIPDPGVFRHSEARISYLTKPLLTEVR